MTGPPSEPPNWLMLSLGFSIPCRFENHGAAASLSLRVCQYPGAVELGSARAGREVDVRGASADCRRAVLGGHRKLRDLVQKSAARQVVEGVRCE